MTSPIERLRLDLAGTAVAVSRATAGDDLRLWSEACPTTVLPITGGVTVWDAAPGEATSVVVTPNLLGVAEAMPSRGRVRGLRRSTGVAAHRDLVDDIDDGAVALRDVRRLWKRLTSLRGIRPYRRVDAPWFTVMAADPDRLIVEHEGVRAERLGEAFPDIPGGVRIVVDAGSTTAHLDGYAAAVAAAAHTTRDDRHT